MKIASSTVGMEAAHLNTEIEQRSEQLSFWNGNRPGAFSRSRPAVAPDVSGLPGWGNDRVTLSGSTGLLQPARPAIANTYGGDARRNRTAEVEGEKGLQNANGRTQFLKRLIEEFTGQKIRIVDVSEFQVGTEETTVRTGAAALAVSTSENEDWGMTYSQHASYYEQETMAFSASGLIRTADGQEVEFSLDLQMSREFYTEQNLSFTTGNAGTTDPLVLNFDGTAAELSSMTFSFDLDVDGYEEAMPFVGESSGFLALDQNGDGRVNDGIELFGPRTGNGFQELAELDEDGNQWIDENDSAFNRLSLWTRNGSGNDRLESLKARGVGALFLGNVKSPFDLKDSLNQLRGQVNSSGIYLQENGAVGSLQQIDMVA